MESTYDKLLNTAIDIMFEEGYAGTSIGILATQVGISKSTVIHYFKSKEGILLAILKDFLPSYIEDLKVIANESGIEGTEKLYQFLQFHMRLLSDKRKVLSINLRDTKYLSGENRVVYQEQQRMYENQVVDIIKQVQNEGACFQGLNPVITAKSILGMCNYASIWYREGGNMGIKDLADHFYALLTGNKHATMTAAKTPAKAAAKKR